MTTWGHICRICSSPAEYKIFDRIPTYLHANANDFQHWQKPLNVLLEETTGLKVTRDDGLPHFACALCISYLKHAVSFRNQVINNALGLKAAMAIHSMPMEKCGDQGKDEKESFLISANDLNIIEERKTDANLLYSSENRDKVNSKQLLNNVGHYPTRQAGVISDKDKFRYLNLLFDKPNNKGTKREKKSKKPAETYKVATCSDHFVEEFQTASSDDIDIAERKTKYLPYREKNFEEDDIMDMAEVKDVVTVNVPEKCKERKCRACFRRFMFEESYTEHMITCIEYKFLTTIEEINRLLDIRRGKAISPHEFIRRMIFCLRKTCEWLKANCAEMLLPDLLQSNEGGVKKLSESEGKSSTPDASSGVGGVKQMRSDKIQLTKDFTFNGAITRNAILSVQSALSSPKRTSRTATPISLENNILYEIERSQSRNKLDYVTKRVSTPVQEEERISFLQKLQNAASSPISTPSTNAETYVHTVSPMISVRKDLLAFNMTSVTPTNSNFAFTARCTLCITVFATLAELEEHNAIYHNEQQLHTQTQTQAMDAELELERDKIIALFEDSDN